MKPTCKASLNTNTDENYTANIYHAHSQIHVDSIRPIKNNYLRMKKIAAFTTLFFFAVLITTADVKMPLVFSSGMVLQRDKELRIWGFADDKEVVTVTFNGQDYKTTTGASGKWSVIMQPAGAGGPYEMIITGRNQIKIEDIMVGDVWICSGQSNMEFEMKRFPYGKDSAKTAKYRDIRYFRPEKNVSYTPQSDVKSGSWLPAVGDNILNLSAVAYFFALNIYADQKVPIGLISTNWGGTNIETWISLESLGKIADFSPVLKEYSKVVKSYSKPSKDEQKFNKWKDDFIYKGSDLKEKWYEPQTDLSAWQDGFVPAKFTESGLKGFTGPVWYRRKFDLPYLFWDQPLELRLGKIDDHCIVYINGTQVGENFTKDRWLTFEVSQDILKHQDNEVVIRITNVSDEGGFLSEPDQLNICRKSNASNCVLLGGTWKMRKGQSVKPAPMPEFTDYRQKPNNNPAGLFNGMLAPFIPMAIKGVIWYQGESNASTAYQYRTTFPAMIKDWRWKFNQGDFPFIFVQLANYRSPVDEPAESEWAELREAQNEALNLPSVGTALAIDIGEAKDIHPKNKQEVGRRLALTAMHIAYSKELTYSGPFYARKSVEANKIYITFKNTGSGLMVKDRYGYLKGFTIAGDDKKFKWAKAEILNDSTIAVYNPEVSKPIAVRYGWADNPDDVNLYNKEGLPASPFRTDTWDGITKGKKYKLYK